MPVKYLSAIQKNAQRAAFKVSLIYVCRVHCGMGAVGHLAQSAVVCASEQFRAEKELRNVLTAEDATAALRLVLHDAATYDADNGTGGINGSIVLRQPMANADGRIKHSCGEAWV